MFGVAAVGAVTATITSRTDDLPAWPMARWHQFFESEDPPGGFAQYRVAAPKVPVLPDLRQY